MQKALSPVIAVILLLLIVIAIVAFSFSFFQRTVSSAGESSEEQLQQRISQVGSQVTIENVYQNKVTVRNVGTNDVDNLQFYAANIKIDSKNGYSLTKNGIKDFELKAEQLAMAPEGSAVKVVSLGFSDIISKNDFYKDNIVGYWKFDEGAGTSAFDSSGNGNSGTLYGNPQWVTGKFDKALGFDGNDYVNFGNILSPGSGDWTTCLWFKWYGTVGENILYNKENLYELAVQSGYVRYAWQPHWNWDGGDTFPVNADEWYHACVKYDHSRQYMYKNGVEVYSRIQTGNIGSNSNYLLIGARGHTSPHNYFNGVIDEVKILSIAIA